MLRALCFTIATSAPLLLAGCLLDAGAFESSGGGGASSTTTPTGAGGAGAATTTTTSTTSQGGATTTTSDGGATTTTSMPECMTAADCPPAAQCKSVECASGACITSDLPDNTFVSNDSATDCIQKVCDGQGHVKDVPAQGETPPPDNSLCHTLSCQNGMVVQNNFADMMLCGPQPADPCSAMACFGGDCVPAKYNDGPYQIGACGEITCTNGVSSPFSLNYHYCPDGMPTNCFVPKCVDTGGGVTACMGSQYAPQNQMCTKQGGGGGFCDAFGNCE